MNQTTFDSCVFYHDETNIIFISNINSHKLGVHRTSIKITSSELIDFYNKLGIKFGITTVIGDVDKDGYKHRRRDKEDIDCQIRYLV